MFKLFNLFSWVTDLVENFTFYGGGKGGSSSTSTTKDFFGVGKRAPYESLLSDLLLGGMIGETAGHYENPAKKGGGGKNKSQGAWIPGSPGVSLTDYMKSRPGFEFQYGLGQDALNRNFAARGTSASGAQDIALQNYGNKYAADYLQQSVNNLMNPAGVNTLGQTSTSTSGGSSLFGSILGAGLSMMGNPFAAAGGWAGAGAGALGAGGLMTCTAPSAGGLAFSDRRLKRDIKLVDIINGYKVYTYKYIWSNQEFKGVMAQDLLETNKDAVTMNKNGYYMVDYSKLGV